MKSIELLNLNRVIHALVDREGWSMKDAQEVSVLYRNFLYLACKYPDKRFPPSEDIDEFWHMHVLHTAQYRSDCDAIFGHYFDHEPENSAPLKKGEQKGSESAFQELQGLYFQEFGDYIYRIRGPFQKLVSMLRKFCQ